MSRRAAYVGGNVLLAAVYFVTGKFGLELALVHTSVSAVWPATGVALAALVLFGPRLWPGVFLGAFLVNVTTPPTPFPAALAMGIGNTLEAVVGAWLVGRFAGGRRAFERAGDALRFVLLAGMAGTAIAASVGATAVSLTTVPRPDFGVLWLTWWLGDMGGAVLLAPGIVLGFTSAPSRRKGARLIEAATLLLLLVATSFFVFRGLPALAERDVPAHYLCTPLLIWAAVRFGPLETAAANLVLAAISVGATLSLRGPFITGSPNASLLLLQSFMVVTATMALVLAVAIHERKEADAALRETARELERSNADLARFAHAASHDLKEPLRTVASFTQLLSLRYAGKLGADADEYIRFAVEGATRMERLINDILAFSRAGSTGLELALTPAEHALDEALAGLRAGVESAGAIVTHAPLPEVRADRSQLVQVFQNLVGNAVKFRGTEPPRIHVSAQPAAEGWVFSVRDNGIGIDPRFSDRVFTMFQRMNSREKYDGSGIGLALCKRIVDRHGGRIWFESEPGKGCTFHFSLPV